MEDIEMAENNKEQVSNEEGQTEMETQVSNNKEGQTVSQPDGSELDLVKEYTLSKLTGEKYTGREIKQRINESKLFREKQSQFDKQTAELAKKEEGYQREIERLKTEKSLFETNSRINRIEQKETDDFDPFAPDEEESTKPMTRVEAPVRQQNNPDDIEKKVMSLVDQRLDLERQQRDLIEKSQNFDRARDRSLRIQLKKEFPSADEDEIQDMIGSMDVVRKNDLDARNRYGDDMDKAMELIIEGDSYSLRAAKAMASAMLKQERAEVKAKQQREIETITKGMFEAPEGKETKPVTNPKNEMKARQQRKKDAEDMLRKMNSVRQNG
jgi:hypothetical protein